MKNDNKDFQEKKIYLVFNNITHVPDMKFTMFLVLLKYSMCKRKSSIRVAMGLRNFLQPNNNFM